MPLVYRLADYARYRERVGVATYVDCSRRTDPARVPGVWDNLRELVGAYGSPWVLQLWTKDIGGSLGWGEEILRTLVRAGTVVTAQVTVTGLAGTEWEPLVPVHTMRDMPSLANAIGGPAHITWRYDPIVPTVHCSERFRVLASQAADVGIRRAVINYVAPPGRYKRVDRRMAALLPTWSVGMPGYDLAWRRQVAEELVGIAEQVGLSLSCCAEGAELSRLVPGLGRAQCGAGSWFASLSPATAPALDAGKACRGSRPGCGCWPYFDVGMYGCWSQCHRCTYCYAG